MSTLDQQGNSWKRKRVIVIGAARQGTALARYLAERGAQVVITDIRPPIQLQTAQEMLADLSIEWIVGGHPLSVLDRADCVCPSGGVSLNLPLVQEALRRGIPVSNDSQIFLESAPCRVIGITGSAGKTTTTTLVGRMAQQASQLTAGKAYPTRAWVGGNIGNPLINALGEMKPDDLAILELSSFQLEIMSAFSTGGGSLEYYPESPGSACDHGSIYYSQGPYPGFPGRRGSGYPGEARSWRMGAGKQSPWKGLELWAGSADGLSRGIY